MIFAGPKVGLNDNVPADNLKEFDQRFLPGVLYELQSEPAAEPVAGPDRERCQASAGLRIYDYPAARSVDLVVGYHVAYRKIETRSDRRNVFTIDMKTALVAGSSPGFGAGAVCRDVGRRPGATFFRSRYAGSRRIPTPETVVDQMLTIAQVRPGEMVYDLGCGDGRIVIAAAQKFKAHAVGIEIRRDIYEQTLATVASLGLSDQVKIVHGNALRYDLSPADVVTLYLLTSSNERLKPILEKDLKPTARVVSHDFEIRGWKPVDRQQNGGRGPAPHDLSVPDRRPLTRYSVSCRPTVPASREYLLTEALFDFLPVHHVPPGGHVFRPAILILQVVGVLPDIEAHHGILAFHQRAVLIGGGSDLELAAVVQQPCPAGAEARGARGVELLLELIEAAECAVDGLGQRAAGLRTRRRAQP